MDFMWKPKLDNQLFFIVSGYYKFGLSFNTSPLTFGTPESTNEDHTFLNGSPLYNFMIQLLSWGYIYKVLFQYL